MVHSEMIQPVDPLIYINGEFIHQSEAKVPFMDSGFWYGDGLFETLLVTNGQLFRPLKHIARMQEGLRILQFDFPVPDAEVVRLMNETITRNRITSAMMRLMCTRGTVPGAPYDYSGKTNLYIAFRYAGHIPEPPLKVEYVSESDYPIARNIPALKSMTYLGNMLAIRNVHANGSYEPVFVNRDELITECAVRNIFYVKGRTLHTPDVSLGILPGVTRDLIMELADDLGLAVSTAPIHRDTVNDMDEAFISSTGIGVSPVYWDGYRPEAYPISAKIKRAVDRQIALETGGSAA